MVPKNEFLLINFGGSDFYAVDVYKIREVAPLGRVALAKGAFVELRGRSIEVFDAAGIVGEPPVPALDAGAVVTCDHGGRLRAFFVRTLKGVVSAGAGQIAWNVANAGGARQGVLQAEGSLAHIVDFELAAMAEGVQASWPGRQKGTSGLAVSSSPAALKVLRSVLAQAETKGDVSGSCAAARRWLARADASELAFVSIDGEMEGCEGYALARQIKLDPKFAAVSVLLHASATSSPNSAMVDWAQADGFLQSFDPESLLSFFAQWRRA